VQEVERRLASLVMLARAALVVAEVMIAEIAEEADVRVPSQ
jgi:hypothetical protein